MIPAFPPMAPPGYGGATTCSAAYKFFCNAYPSNTGVTGLAAK